jgi:chromosome segregation ATPase
MIEKVKNKLNEVTEEHKKWKEERTRIAMEKAEAEVRKERERIQAEKDALMALSEKELLVEVIMALRGYNTRLDNIEARQNDLNDRVESLEFRANSLESDLSDSSSIVNELKINQSLKE